MNCSPTLAFLFLQVVHCPIICRTAEPPFAIQKFSRTEAQVWLAPE